MAMTGSLAISFAWRGRLCAAMLLCAAALAARADQVQMQNGDRYAGRVLSLNSNMVVLQSDVLGWLLIPRSNVVSITLGATPAIAPGSTFDSVLHTNLSRLPASTNRPPSKEDAEFSAAVRQLGGHTNLIQQVQKQFLAGAGPEANDKFNELLGGLMSGKVSLDDLRAQARSAADQLRSLKRELGEENGFVMDSYLAILDRFLKESPPAGSSVTNAPPR